MRLSTLKKRAEFQRVRGGGRWTTPSFVLEGKARPTTDSSGDQTGLTCLGPRFGFTITKKIGGAVVRNRIRRRLKAALAEVAKSCADPHFDYVVVARNPALNQPFELLKIDLQTALQRVRTAARTRPSRESRSP